MKKFGNMVAYPVGNTELSAELLAQFMVAMQDPELTPTLDAALLTLLSLAVTARALEAYPRRRLRDTVLQGMCNLADNVARQCVTSLEAELTLYYDGNGCDSFLDAMRTAGERPWKAAPLGGC